MMIRKSGRFLRFGGPQNHSILPGFHGKSNGFGDIACIRVAPDHRCHWHALATVNHCWPSVATIDHTYWRCVYRLQFSPHIFGASPQCHLDVTRRLKVQASFFIVASRRGNTRSDNCNKNGSSPKGEIHRRCVNRQLHHYGNWMQLFFSWLVWILFWC